MWHVHIRKMQNLQIVFAYIKKWWSENFYLFSFVRLVGPILSTTLRSIFLTERFFFKFNKLSAYDHIVLVWSEILNLFPHH